MSTEHMRVVDSSFTSDGETVKCAYCNKPWPCPDAGKDDGYRLVPTTLIDAAVAWCRDDTDAAAVDTLDREVRAYLAATGKDEA